MEQPPILSPVFCAPCSLNLTIKRKMKLKVADVTTDVNGNKVLAIKSKWFSLPRRCTLLDPAGNTIPILKWKPFSANRRWLVFKKGHLSFSVKKSSLFQCKPNFDVFLAANTKEDFCDFKIKGSSLERSCTIYTIYLGDTSTIIAQVKIERNGQISVSKIRKKLRVHGVVLGKENSTVIVYPNVDYAFFVALVGVLREINKKTFWSW